MLLLLSYYHRIMQNKDLYIVDVGRIQSIGDFWAKALIQLELMPGRRWRRVAHAEVDLLAKDLLWDLLKCWRQQLQGLQEPAGPAGLMLDLQMGSPPKHTPSWGEGGATFGSLRIKLCHGRESKALLSDSRISFQKCFVELVCKENRNDLLKWLRWGEFITNVCIYMYSPQTDCTKFTI